MGTTLRAVPVTFRPLGLYDALEGEGAPPGACAVLQNLVHDVTTPFMWSSRPAAVQLSNFPALLSPGVVSVMLAVGTRVYGMIATAQFPGYDVPFCYDTATSLFSTLSGVTSSNIPATQATSGPWTPPTMAVIGSKIVVTHPGFSGSGSNFFGVIDIATIASPTWTAANTTSNALPAVPTAVAQFNNRAYFAVNNKAYYTDSLAPTTITNSTQFLTLGSTGSDITGFGGLPIQQTQGGVLLALVGFKAEGFWQIAGDTATSNLTLNGPFTPGTRAPRTITQLPIGLGYMADSGIRIIGFDGTVQEAPLSGVRAPFQSCPVPSRACGSYSNTVYRVALQAITNPLLPVATFVEYWYDFEINQWSGPHTFCSDAMVPMTGSFICASNRAPGRLFQSDVDPSSTSTVVELGATMPFRLQSTILPDDTGMSMKTIVESQIDISFGASSNSLTAQFLTAANGIAGTAMVDAVVGTYWNQFNWNQALWGSAEYGLRVYNIAWSAPVVYKTGAFALFGALSKGMRIGPVRFRVEELNYMNAQGLV